MSFNTKKTDPILGAQVQAHLESVGLHTPTIATNTTSKQKIAAIEPLFKQIMEIMGLDLNDDSLNETPKRVSKMFIGEVFWGLDPEAFPKCTAVNNRGYDEMLIEHDIQVKSFCEHHFLPITGTCTIAYFPTEKVIGLSKMPRLVEYFCRRPQIQERLTDQIYHALSFVLGTDDIAVLMHADHSCVSMRGVEDETAFTTTSKLGGKFRTDEKIRSEFMRLATMQRPAR